MKNGKYKQHHRIVYYKNNKYHREDGPAIILTDGTTEWYKNGELHRIDGPAVEYPNGDKYWYINDEMHREDGPAVEYPNGHKEWHFHDKLHREDGPAIELANNQKLWYLNDKRYTEEEYNKIISPYYSISLSKNDLNIVQMLFSFYHLILPEIKSNIIVELKDKFLNQGK